MTSEIYDKITTKAICTSPRCSSEFTKAVKTECKKAGVKYSDYCNYKFDFQSNSNEFDF